MIVIPASIDAAPEADREVIEERAAIMQFDGGLPAKLAEHYALSCVAFTRAGKQFRMPEERKI